MNKLKENVCKMERSAKFSDCKKYRYSLSRIWDENKQKVLFIMINPSFANEEILDPTVTRCVNMFKSNMNFNYIGGVFVLNLFPYIDPNIKNLVKEPDEIEQEHLEEIKQFINKDYLVIAAWGSQNKLPSSVKKAFFQKVENIKQCFPKLKCLRILKNGDPQHPLMVKYPKAEKDLIDFI